MKTIELGTHTVNYYTSIKELPIDLSKKMQHYLLQHTGIGSTIEDIDDHLARLITFLSNDKKAEALEELTNMRFNMFVALTETRYDAPAFACLVHSVDGVKVEDRSIDALTALMEQLSSWGLSEQMLAETIEEVKKNLIPSAAFTSLDSLART